MPEVGRERRRSHGEMCVKSLMRGFLAWCRRHPILSATVTIVLVLLFVPLAPIAPDCRSDMFPHLGEKMSIVLTPVYRGDVKGYLRDFGVYHWDIGGVLLVRVLPFIDDNDRFDQENAILNATKKAGGPRRC